MAGVPSARYMVVLLEDFGMNPWWSAKEEGILRKYYRKGGAERVEKELLAEGFSRTRTAITAHARIMRIKAERTYRQESTNDKISVSKLGNRNRWDYTLDKLYEEAKKIVATGVQVSCACEATGITRDQYYRRKRIEETGRDRL